MVKYIIKRAHTSFIIIPKKPVEIFSTTGMEKKSNVSKKINHIAPMTKDIEAIEPSKDAS